MYVNGWLNPRSNFNVDSIDGLGGLKKLWLGSVSSKREIFDLLEFTKALLS